MKFIVSCGGVYYHDTRGEPGHGSFSDFFTSSIDRDYATRYASREAAEDWAAEFLTDSPYTIEPVEQLTITYQGIEAELNWEKQTVTLVQYPGSGPPVLPISFIAYILQKFGGFRIALNPADWKGVHGSGS
jgi:uncharacterized iron-regulated membrane protein